MLGLQTTGAAGEVWYEHRPAALKPNLYLLRRQQKVGPRFGMAVAVCSMALREYRRQMERALGAELVKACTSISCWRRYASSRPAGR